MADKKYNTDNLVPIKKGDLSKDELKRRQSNGGKKSAEVRKERKILKEEILKRLGEADIEEMVLNLIDRSKTDNKSFEVLRDTIGQKPKEQVEAIVDNVIHYNVKIDAD